MHPAGSEAAALDTPTLVVVAATANERAGALRVVAGLTVLERAVRQLRRMGHRVLVATDGTIALPPLPPAVEVRSVAGRGSIEDLRRDRGAIAVVAADLVRPANREVSGGLRVTDEESRRRAEDAVFAELLRGDLGFVARHLNKPISFRITRYLLCHLPVTPNQVTLGAAAIGLAGCALIASGERWLVVLGFLLAHLQSVLDGCDGELARVRFQQSAIGEWLDTIVDDGLNLLLVASIGVGLGRAHHTTFPTVVGFITSAMLLTYNAVAYRELHRQGEGGEVLKVRWWFLRGGDVKQLVSQQGPMRLLSTVARRDFFLLAWLVLAAVGLVPVVQVYALLVVIPSFVIALGQLVLRPGGTRP
ncbi:MAG TPA: CDP-alcohol phosphatidyltransferase family protein [Polyangia bacterium]|nr:CDP-alcohol phosphatidyltransferase family protein [Polyangia bacterium]